MSEVITTRRRHSARATQGSAFTDIANYLAEMSYAIADYFEDPSNAVFISKVFYGFILVLLLAIAGIMSGLTLALFTLDARRLRGYTTGSSLRLKQQAIRVLPLLENPHWTLCTLLLCNAAAVETLPLVLGHIVHPLAAVVLSVVLVLVFGEILPQAFFAKHALEVSSFFAGFVGIVMVFSSPVSWPAGWVLDALVGHKEQSLLRRTELKQLLRLRRKHQKIEKVAFRTKHMLQELEHRDHELQMRHPVSPLEPAPVVHSETSALLKAISPAKSDSSVLTKLKRWTVAHLPSKIRETISVSSSDSEMDEGPDNDVEATLQATTKKQAIEDNEMKIMLGALSLSELQIKDVMPARAKNIFFLEKNEEITRDVVAAVFNHGFSRIPVFCAERKEFISYFLARSLICFIYPQATWSAHSSSGMNEILQRKRCRLESASGGRKLSNEWVTGKPTVVHDLPQHEALYCSADTMLGEVYEDLITLHSPVVFVLKAVEEHPPPQLDHTGTFNNYGSILPESSSSFALPRHKVSIAEPLSPLTPKCHGVETFSSKAHGVFSAPCSMAVSPEPRRLSTSLDSDDMPSGKTHQHYHHFQKKYLKLVEEGPTSGMLTFEDVVEVVHGISVVDEFDWESHGRIQSEWRNRLAVARVIQKGTSFIKPSTDTRERSSSLGVDGDVSRRLVSNLGLESTTRTSDAFNFSFSRHATTRR